MAKVTTEVEVDLDDFDDDDIAREFEARGLGDPDSSDGAAVGQIRRLIEMGDVREAIILIERLCRPLKQTDEAAFAKALANRDPASGRPLIL